MAAWRYLFADLLTDRTLDILELEQVRFDRRIIQPGAFGARLPIPSSTLGDRARQSVREGRTVVHVYRDADIWGSYIIWVATPAADQRGRVALTLQGASLESYPHHREIRTDLDYVDVDQLQIARNLVGDMQARPEGDIGLVTGSETSAVLREQHYLRSEAATYGLRLEQLADLINGFEYTIRTFVDPDTGQRLRKFVTGYPTLGQASVDHVFATPGKLVSWSLPGDAIRGGTSFQTRGDIGQDFQPLMSGIFEADQLLAQGWPLLDKTEDRQSVREVNTLNEWAQALRARLAGSVVIPHATVRLDETTQWNPNRLGDKVRLRLVNEWFPLSTDPVTGKTAPIYDRAERVVGCEIVPASREQGHDTATLIFEEPSAAA